MKRVKRGFTTVELVVTIALVGVLSAMTAVSIAAMVNIQNNASSNASRNEQIDDASQRIESVVSFVSVGKADGALFNCLNTETPSSTLTFAKVANPGNSAQYTLQFTDKTLSFTHDSEQEGYFDYAFTMTYSQIESIEFSYFSELKLLKAVLSPFGGTAVTHMYTLEALE